MADGKPQGSQCIFFLWEDDAKIREKRENQLELANSQSEPRTPIQSPTRGSSARVGGLLTPSTGRAQPEDRSRWDVVETPTRPRRTTYIIDDSEDDEDDGRVSEFLDNENDDNISVDESFHNADDDNGDGSSDESSDSENDDNGDESLEDEVDNLVDRSSPSPTQTPRTSRKRTFEDFNDQPPPYSETASASQSADASTTRRRIQLPRRSQAHLSALSSNVLSIIDSHGVVVPTGAWDEAAAFLELKQQTTQALMRERDMLETSLNKKNEENRSLKKRLRRLEKQRQKAISCLRSDN